uniref:Uncharacterized protein n=1 Tax=Glossina austeni TaxID=7395 RepID=A0A1A9VLR9_GLOAU
MQVIMFRWRYDRPTFIRITAMISNAPAIEETALSRMFLFPRFGCFLSKITDGSLQKFIFPLLDFCTKSLKKSWIVMGKSTASGDTVQLFCLNELKLTSKSSSSSCHLMDEIKCLEKSTNKAIKTNNHHITESKKKRRRIS